MLARPPYPKHTEEIAMEDMIRLLAAELGQKPQHVGAVVRLLDEGNTIPFIARYRKEQHGAMDDTTLRTLAERRSGFSLSRMEWSFLSERAESTS